MSSFYNFNTKYKDENQRFYPVSRFFSWSSHLNSGGAGAGATLLRIAPSS